MAGQIRVENLEENTHVASRAERDLAWTLTPLSWETLFRLKSDVHHERHFAEAERV